MMMCFGDSWKRRDRRGKGEAEGSGCFDPSEVSNTHTQLLLSLAHSTHNTVLAPANNLFPLCMCLSVCVPVCESVILFL